MPNKIKTVTPEVAEAEGFNPITYPIDPVNEQWILDNILKDMNAGEIPCVLVQQPKGLEVWRKSRNR